MRCHRFKCLLAFVCFVSVTWIKSVHRDAVPPVMQTLYKRLLAAEERGVEVNRNLSSILEQLRNLSKAETLNSTKQPTGDPGQQIHLQPNIYFYMPHLRRHSDSLVPNVVLGQGRRGVSMVLGVPTVKRSKQSYLVSTLQSLLFNLSPSQRQDLLIIVFVAEVDSDYVNSIAQAVSKNFPTDVQSGLLEVVSPSQFYYPDFSNLTETLGDSKERVKWRTKQNLDFSFLMLYAKDKGTYYVQLEDDVVAKKGYYNAMKTFADQEASKPWIYLEFSHLGFIGKMFRTRDLAMITDFFLMFHRDKPIDWLLDHILWVKVCNPEKDAKHCAAQKASLKQRYKPSLFQHVGLHSSLPGKLQPLKDKDFGKQTLYFPHINPPAALNSSLQHYQQHSLQRAYRGEDFFWALTPVKGDYIIIQFPQPIHITGFLFRSGNTENFGDKMDNTTVEVLPSNGSTQDKESERYTRVGEFVDGVATGTIEDVLQPVSALRLVVHSNSDVWTVMSEIHIKV
ncbi:alpha-1,3-mannosyl-glycoprotein 4-beta-N-acetylglucosaminyltransferase B-like [Solea solea]|uniref:alpha-1,3-mannosyl-glycoprotein 4-beta-N-acetylglucosaminyltransferase B-like n=1 Tax=Solea solea TaxID=90069 RepID=UPI00272B7EF2|nr:alpha-1,3-mannosyl-glycoprotein 4-beta-N-acetylglucosaminyltransferase B-like [Solea solea]